MVPRLRLAGGTRARTGRSRRPSAGGSFPNAPLAGRLGHDCAEHGGCSCPCGPSRARRAGSSGPEAARKLDRRASARFARSSALDLAICAGGGAISGAAARRRWAREVVDHRRLPLVRRMGTRCDDRVAGAGSGDRADGYRAIDAVRVSGIHSARIAAQHVFRERRAGVLQQRGRHAVVHPRAAAVCAANGGPERGAGGVRPTWRRRWIATRAEPDTAFTPTLPTACFTPASPERK